MMGALLVASLGAGLGACSQQKKDVSPPDDTGPAACQEDAMECPDGSTVAREGEDCEFPPCPTEDGEDMSADAGDEAEEAAADGEGEAEPEEADAE